ncbi:hypothetical protein LLG95_07580 [bacterium]|nr:hypothetical protein [bacterium]
MNHNRKPNRFGRWRPYVLIVIGLLAAAGLVALAWFSMIMIYISRHGLD